MTPFGVGDPMNDSWCLSSSHTLVSFIQLLFNKLGTDVRWGKP